MDSGVYSVSEGEWPFFAFFYFLFCICEEPCVLRAYFCIFHGVLSRHGSHYGKAYRQDSGLKKSERWFQRIFFKMDCGGGDLNGRSRGSMTTINRRSHTSAAGVRCCLLFMPGNL